MALDMLCQEMHEAWYSGDTTERPAVTACVLSSHRDGPWQLRRGLWREETTSEKEAWQVLVD